MQPFCEPVTARKLSWKKSSVKADKRSTHFKYFFFLPSKRAWLEKVDPFLTSGNLTFYLFTCVLFFQRWLLPLWSRLRRNRWSGHVPTQKETGAHYIFSGTAQATGKTIPWKSLYCWRRKTENRQGIGLVRGAGKSLVSKPKNKI